MSDESEAPARTRTRSREQLLKLLHHDPGAVSRAEIKAAFADGRLGDQDLDIPVLAGMRRITELLAELQPDPGVAQDAGTGTDITSANVAATRTAGMTARLADVEERLTRLEAETAEVRSSPSPTAADLAELRGSMDRIGASVTRLEAANEAGDRRLRQASILAFVSLVAAIAALVIALVAR